MVHVGLQKTETCFFASFKIIYNALMIHAIMIGERTHEFERFSDQLYLLHLVKTPGQLLRNRSQNLIHDLREK